MNYALGYSFSLKDIYEKLELNRLQIKYKDLPEGILDKRDLCRKMFADCMWLVLNDIIDNNVTFELPKMGKRRSNIHMHRITGKEFAYARRNGQIFKDVDFLKSGFSGYALQYDMYTGDYSKSKRIHVSNNLKDKITQHTNEGKQYC